MSAINSAHTSTITRATPPLTHLNMDWKARYEHSSFDFGPLGERVAGEMFTEIRSSRGAEQDSLLYGLLVAARDGNHHAERVLIQVLLAAAARMAHRVRRLDELDRYDRVGYAIAAAWESINSHKMHLGERVHANLTCRMLSLLSPEQTKNDTEIHAATITVPDCVFENLTDEEAEPVEVKLLKLFTWAVDSGVVAKDEVALLSRAFLSGYRHQDIADELGGSLNSLRHTVYRIRERISDAVREQQY